MKSHATRKLLLTLLPLVLCSAAITHVKAATPARNWEFSVLLDDKEIGYHTFSVTQDGDGQRFETEAKFDVKFLFITAFRYRHQNVEAWSNGCLASIDASTNSNGEKFEVSGRRTGGRFELLESSAAVELPTCVQTFAYWNPDILQARNLLNSQTGEYENVEITREGRDTVAVGDELIAADRYRLSAKAGDITLWYAAADQRWLALEAPAKGGRTIRYEPKAVPDAAIGREQYARSS